MDFVFQPCDAVCESHESTLMLLLFHDCCSVAWLIGVGTPNCHVRERVFEEGGATWAAAVATCAQVLMCVVGLIVVTALRSCEARCLRRHLHLDNSAANVEGLLLDPVMVVTQGVLIGLTVGMSLVTLGIGACICMEHVICLLSSVWGMGVLAGVCTLGTCCILRI